MTPSSATQGKLGQAVVGFSRDGLFPEVEEISAAAISRSELQVASGVLKYASTELEVWSSLPRRPAHTDSIV